MRFNSHLTSVTVLILSLGACGKPATPPVVTGGTAQVVSQPVPATEVAYQATLQDGIVFAKPGYPSFIKEVRGMSEQEPSGRWTDGPSAVFVFKEPIQGKIQLEISGIPYGSNAGKKIPILVGGERQEVVFGGKTSDFETVAVSFDLKSPADTLELQIPEPTIPPGGNRKLGIFLGTLKFK